MTRYAPALEADGLGQASPEDAYLAKQCFPTLRRSTTRRVVALAKEDFPLLTEPNFCYLPRFHGVPRRACAREHRQTAD